MPGRQQMCSVRESAKIGFFCWCWIRWRYREKQSYHQIPCQSQLANGLSADRSVPRNVRTLSGLPRQRDWAESGHSGRGSFDGAV